VAFRFLPESPRWLAAAGRDAEAAAVCDRFERATGLPSAVVADIAAAPVVDEGHEKDRFWSGAGRAYRARAALLCALNFLSPWATTGFPLLTGAVLIEKGYRVADSLLYLGIAMLGPSIGVLAGSVFIDRIERRSALALCAGTMALIGLAFAASDAPLSLMAAGVAFTVIGAIYVGALSIYGAELFPTALRAAVSSSAWGVNRVASALVPLALLPLLKSTGPIAMFAVIAATLCASAVIILVFGQRGLAGKPVA
jgi:MFS transporter, putative metabolite:H+ symporter